MVVFVGGLLWRAPWFCGGANGLCLLVRPQRQHHGNCGRLQKHPLLWVFPNRIQAEICVGVLEPEDSVH